MSFGVSVGDFITVGELCWTYKKCKDSPGNYKQLSVEVGTLHNVIKETEELLSQQEMTAMQKKKLQESRLGCQEVLRDLDALLAKYDSLGTKSQRTFDRMGFGMADIDSIRGRLTLNVSLLDAFNNASSHARLEHKLNLLIAEIRSGKRDGSVVSTKTIDSIARNKQETWDALRRDLEDVGISPIVIAEKRQFIVAWFQEAILLGKLEEVAPEDRTESDVAAANLSDAEVVERKDWAIDSSNNRVHQRTSGSDLDQSSNDRRKNYPEVRSRLNVSYLLDKLKSRDRRLLEAYWKDDHFRMKRQLEAGANPNINVLQGSPGFRLLHGASIRNQSELTRLLLGRGAEINAEDSDKSTPLHLASLAGSKDCMQLLLGHPGVEIEAINTEQMTPLQKASQEGHAECVRLLLEAGAIPEASNRTSSAAPLHLATARGHLAITELLLNNGADVDIKTSHQMRTPLHVAAAIGYTEITQLLLNRGAKVDVENSSRETPLHVASINGHTEVAKLLLNHGAKVDTKDNYGRTPLHVVSRNGHHEIAELLLDHGGELDAKDIHDQTPLYNASVQGRIHLLSMFLNYGAKVETKDCKGRTPLYAASEFGYTAVVQLLLEHGAKAEIRDFQGRTPLFRALELGNAAVVQLLLEHGAISG